MQFKVILALVFGTLAAATAIPDRRQCGGGGGGGGGGGPSSQCDTGDLQCCNSVQEADSPDASELLGLLGIDIEDVTGLVGLTCSPISVIGIGGNSCTAQPVCCTDNSFSGLIAIGCTPVNINL